MVLQQPTTWKKYTATRVNRRDQTFLHIDGTSSLTIFPSAKFKADQLHQ